MGMSGTIDILFLASGCYLTGTAVMAKKRGSMVASVMLGKNMSENDISDKEGFINYMYKRLLLSGLMIVVASVIHLVNDYYIKSNALTWGGSILILAALIIYTRTYMTGQKKYMVRGGTAPGPDSSKQKNKE